MKKVEPKELMIIAGVPLILFLFCLIFANWILSKSTIVGLGICLFFLPFLIFAIKYLRNRPISQTKLFD